VLPSRRDRAVEIAMVIAALLVGFLAGVFSFRVKSRWCEQCGVTLQCPECNGNREATR
jgi:hypothetical protein